MVLVFVDVVGSTRLSTQMDSEDFADLMLEFQQLGRGVFEAYGGSVAHYLGDGLLVCFGYPQARENDAERAVRAAFHLLGQLRDRHMGRMSEPLQARVGVHTGTVVVGTGKDGEGGILLGEAVNVAARIQSAAEPDTVFASNEALDLLKGKFASRAQDPVTLKGVAQQVVLHHIRRPAASKPAYTASAVTMVGRITDLDCLTGAMADARQGVRTGVSITGEPGLGKTTLIHAFRAALGDDPHIWLEARCDVLQTGAACIRSSIWRARALASCPITVSKTQHAVWATGSRFGRTGRITQYRSSRACWAFLWPSVQRLQRKARNAYAR